jgi:lipopolysaccharide transport system ATP-binding protein
MEQVVIQAEGLGKRYRIGERARYLALRDLIGRTLDAPARLLSKNGNGSLGGQKNFIWALKDVSFDIREGEVVGLIGRNGAGKSTLLKILARITRPTEGSAEIRGRVGSLLEVGTGFHPELTGRENVYLSGAILGMKKAEIDRKFEEIVSFSEVERFLDTPLKHYSSGMQMRLAFAVAAHLDPEILLVDEVLAVGDLQFQKKCLGKMGDVARTGRTIIFVSHQMNQIRRLCGRGMWVDGGKIRESGDTGSIVSAYEAAMRSPSSGDAARSAETHFTARFRSWEILGADPGASHSLASSGPVNLRFGLEIARPVQMATHGIALFNNEGQLLWGTDVNNVSLQPGRYGFTYAIPGLPLLPGAYHWRVSLYNEVGLLDSWDCLPQMLVVTEPVTHSRDEWAGLLNIPCRFQIETNAD